MSYNKIVKTIVSSNYCFYNSLLRPKSLSMPYSCRAYLSTAAQPCKVGRDEYDRMDIGNCDTAIKKEKSCGGDSSLHPQDLTFQGRQAAVVPLHDKKRHQELCVRLCLQRLRACFLRLFDRWQVVALDEQHYCACQFGVKTVVLSACGKCVRQFVPSECGLNSLVRQQ